MKKHLSGFVQVLILPFFILGAIAVTAGSYYAVKHIPQSVNEGKIIVGEGNKTEVVNNEPTVRVDDGMPSILSGRPNILIEKGTSSPSSVPSQQKISINNKVSSSKQVEAGTNFDSLISQAEEQIKLLEQDKTNFQILRKTINEHQQKAVDHTNTMMNDWVSFTESNISTVPSQYQPSLRLTKEGLISDREYVIQSIKSFYSVLDLYFIDSMHNKENIEVIVSWQNDLNDCIKTWKSHNKDVSCSFSLGLISDLRGGYVDDYNKITSKLVEVDSQALELINNHAKMAGNTVSDDLERIYRIANIVATAQSNLAQIQQRAVQSYSQPVFTQSIQCYTTTNSSIFDKNRTYNTRCEPVTITTAQRCASHKAGQLSGGAVIIDSQPDPACN